MTVVLPYPQWSRSKLVALIYLFFSLGTTVLAAALQKKNARKRRGGPGGGSMSSGGKIKFYLSHI